MTSVLLMFLLPVIKVQRVLPVPSCPVSCVVCSEDAVICQRLAHFIDAAESTQALLLTGGSISAVQPASLSDLTNITVLGLSDNHISELGENSFRNLPFLQTLLLDHNFLTSQTLQGGVLTNLTQLEVLALGHNLINMIQAGWFKGTKALMSLKLEGNLLTSLNSGSFPLNDFRDLESLDLSDNLIQHLDRYSFRGLVSLRTLDLSRNRLSSAPAEAFTYLNWLTNLNLDLNSWNCSCELLELAAVLSSFIQQPDKNLYNGRRMVCVSADNPAVTTVLELTETNCVPSNKNITVQVETRGSVTPQLYARDLAITAVICFIGGVGLTLLVVLIYYQVSRRKNMKESQRLKVEEERSSTVGNHLDVRERTRAVLGFANRREPWNKEVIMLDEKPDRHGGQFRSRADDNNLQGPDYVSEGQLLKSVRRDNWRNGGIRTEEDKERRRVRMMMMMEEDRNRAAFQQHNSNKFYSHPQTNSTSHPLREMTQTLPSHKANRNMDNHRVDVEVRGYETLRCKKCHRMYKPPEQDERINSHSDVRGRGRNGPFENVKNTEMRGETRNVKFNLQNLESRSGSDELEAGSYRDKEKEKERRNKVRSGRTQKVKLNLDPLKKNKIHPGEQGHSENMSYKKRKEKRHHRRREEEEGEERKHVKKSKSSSKTRRKSSKTEDGEEEQKDEQKEKKSREQDRQQSSQEDQVKNPNPASSQPAADQSASAAVSSTSLQTFQYQTAAQFSSQHPFSLIHTDKNQTTNLSLLGPAGSQLTSSMLLSTHPSRSNSLLPGGPANPITPGLGFSGFSAPRGSTENLSRPAAGGIMSSAPSIPAAQITSLQSGSVQTAPLYVTQAEELSLAKPAANPALSSQSQLLPDSSALVTVLKSDPAMGHGFQTGEGRLQLPSTSQAVPPKDGVPEQSQEEVSGLTSQAPSLETTVENMSNNNSQMETRLVPASSSVNMPSGSVPSTEGSVVGGSGEVSLPDMSMQGESSAAAALMQQEYLSEEGGSSPRRRLRLVLPEKTSSRPPTALERKIR